MQTEIRRPIKFLREDVYWERLSSILLALSTDYPIMTNWWTDTWSRTAPTMAKVIWQDDIARMQKKSCRYLVLFARRQHASRSWSCYVHSGQPFWGRGDRRRSAMLSFAKERWRFPIGSPLWPLRFSNNSTAICNRMFPKLESTGNGSFCGNILGRKGLTDLRKAWVVACKRKRVDIFYRVSTIHERDRQTGRQTTER